MSLRAQHRSGGFVTEKDKQSILSWIIERGLSGDPEDRLMQDFCERCCAAGIPLVQGMMMVDTLHPVYEGRTFSWKRDSAEGVRARSTTS